MSDELFYALALRFIKGIGDANAKTIVSYVGSFEKIFKTPVSKLQKIAGVGPKAAELFRDTAEAFDAAKKELKRIEKNEIKAVFYFDKCYPQRLLQCPDAPFMLFYKGDVRFNESKYVSIIGTRNNTEYGRMLTEKLVADLATHEIHVVSGLAYGIDSIAHREALKYNIQNIAVLGHGLDKIYPFVHRKLAEQLQQRGAIVSEFLCETLPDKQNFPKRNRIVAGMTDCTIVVESGLQGGAMITAELANSYNRDVCAYPGNVNLPYSMGCNALIRQNKAHLVTSAEDILDLMGWKTKEDKKINKKNTTPQLFVELNEHEQMILAILQKQEKIHIDDLCLQIPFSQSILSAGLLTLEMKNCIQTLPGKMYKVM